MKTHYTSLCIAFVRFELTLQLVRNFSSSPCLSDLIPYFALNLAVVALKPRPNAKFTKDRKSQVMSPKSWRLICNRKLIVLGHEVTS